MAKERTKSIDLGLQGGGSHGAFTWGVLDRLLEDQRLSLKGISGTSAGAFNAVVMVDGLNSGGRQGAQEALYNFWRAVSDLGLFSPIQRTPLDRLLGRWSFDMSPSYWWFDWMTRVVSPYQFNPFNINPLRDLLVQQVDFNCVRSCISPKLFISATNVRTGRAKIFRGNEITPDVVMASACLPQVFQAVEIDGEAYWDGGYMGNPALFPLTEESEATDIIIIQVNPIVRDQLPHTSPEISNRLNEITFNASLIRDVSSILLLKQLIDTEHLSRVQYADIRLHRISAEAELSPLGTSSKFNVEWVFLQYLHDIGYNEADRWLEQNFDCLGVESTFDASSIYFEAAIGQRKITATPVLEEIS